MQYWFHIVHKWPVDVEVEQVVLRTWILICEKQVRKTEFCLSKLNLGITLSFSCCVGFINDPGALMCDWHLDCGRLWADHSSPPFDTRLRRKWSKGHHSTMPKKELIIVIGSATNVFIIISITIILQYCYFFISLFCKDKAMIGLYFIVVVPSIQQLKDSIKYCVYNTQTCMILC